ncbi:hypothetical protein GQ457_15G019410 [Hibiscus cannabinus]
MFAASFDRKMGCLYSVFDVKKQGKPVWVVRARNWKLRGGENRLPGLLEGVSISSVGKARRQGGSNITFVQVRMTKGMSRTETTGPALPANLGWESDLGRASCRVIGLCLSPRSDSQLRFAGKAGPVVSVRDIPFVILLKQNIKAPP